MIDAYLIRLLHFLNMAKVKEPITLDSIKLAHAARVEEIRRRMADFDNIREAGSDTNFWEEMVFCFFTGGCSARMGLNSLDAVRSLLPNGTQEELAKALTGVHRYPNARARYIIASREFLREHCGMELRNTLNGFSCGFERRDWLAREKRIKGLGYKEASHYLRNVGFKGYAILDKHVLNCLAELKLIDDPKPPNTRSRYLTVEEKMRKLADRSGVDFDDLDLVLWSMKTGVILK